MRPFLLLLTLFIFSSNMYSQSFKKKYKNQLEPKSKLIDSDYNYTIEKVNDTLFVYKKYFPGNKQITDYISFADKKLTIRNGLYKKMYDDGTVVSEGYYSSGEQEGQWIEESDLNGRYSKGKKTGKWKSRSDDSKAYSEMNYLDGELHGKSISYDSLENVIWETEYIHEESLATVEDTTTKVVEVMPRFPGCDDEALSGKELHDCGTRELLTYIYTQLKYPSNARENNVEGMALFQFVIDKEGNVTDVRTLNGISEDIKKECLRLINKMPKWTPGYQDGKPVKVEYTLPVRFKLEG